MLQDPHYPSHLSVALVFIVLVFLMGGVFTWTFFINFGTVKLKSDQSFHVTVNGKSIDCGVKFCQVSLSPKSYQFFVQSKGYYDQTFSISVDRWKTEARTLIFELIPYLKPLTGDLLAPEQNVRLVKGKKGVLNLVRLEGNQETLISSFETLKDPSLQVVADKALILDDGRAFFVMLSDGRKWRRFDDSVRVKQALMSDHGKRTIFFVEDNGQNRLFVWNHENNELNPLSWYESSDRIQWDFSQDHRLLVLSNQLSEEQSLFKKVKKSLPGASKIFQLLRYNLDTEEIRNIIEFSEKIPQKLSRVGDRYVVEYEEGGMEELIVK